MASPLAPELIISDWLNTASPLSLAGLRGRVVLIEAFQMLCPGCVSHGLPQAAKAHQIFAKHGLQVIGLHSVFEHHAAQGTRAALEAFAHEYRLPFPLAIDAAGENGPLPQTMQAYRLQGTPSQILIDKTGHIRLQHFGQMDDMVLGAEIMALLKGADAAASDMKKAAYQDGDQGECGPDGCPV